MLDVKDLEKQHDSMREAKRREQPAWRDIARILRPDDQDFERGEDRRRDVEDFEVFDSTPMYALENFVGGLFGESINPAERWGELTIEDKDLAKWGPVQGWLWKQMNQLLSSVSPSVSQFYIAAQPTFANMGAFGNGFLYQEEWVGQRTIIDKTIPVGQAFIDVDAADRLYRFNREFKWTGEQMKGFFGPEYVGAHCDDARAYQIVHSVFPNPQIKRGVLGPRGMALASTYWSPDKKDFRVDRGYYEMPYHGFQWNQRAGKAWATGPGHNARADMNTNNEMERSSLVSAQFDAEPPLLVRDENVFSAADIQPHALLDGVDWQHGKPMMSYLERQGNSRRADEKTQARKEAIKEAFFFGLLQVRDRPQMTATEFMGWKEERLRQLGPNLVRIQQGLAGFVKRRYMILQRAGQTIPPPPELQGHPIAVEFVSPLAKAQKLATGRAVMQWIGALGQIAEFSQDPGVMDVVNKDGASRVLHDGMVGMPDVINDQRTVEQIRSTRAQQQQEKQQIEQAAQRASIVADVAHASQAMTLSKQRGNGKAA